MQQNNTCKDRKGNKEKGQLFSKSNRNKKKSISNKTKMLGKSAREC